MSDHINVTFTCKSCGASPATLELPDDHTDDSIARCKSCGTEFGRFGDIKAEAMKIGKDHVRGMIEDTFKGLKGWKLK